MLVILFHWNKNQFSILRFKVNTCMKTFYSSLISRHLSQKWFTFIIDFYSDTIPFDGVPSYKGQAVKYSYKITVGTSRVQGQSKLLRLPIRILVLQGWYQIIHVCQYTLSGRLIIRLSSKTTRTPTIVALYL